MWESEFNLRLNRLIYISGLDCDEIAEKLGIGVRTLFNYRKGRAIPNAQVIAKMCLLFGCDANYLLLGITEGI